MYFTTKNLVIEKIHTLDKERAIWFADRFGQNGFVKERLVRKEEVFAYTSSREENEIIILK